MKAIALSNLKLADLKDLTFGDRKELNVTLKGMTFGVKKSASGSISDWVVLESGQPVYPFSSIADLKEYVRTAVGAAEELAAQPKVPQGWTEVEGGFEAEQVAIAPMYGKVGGEVLKNLESNLLSVTTKIPAMTASELKAKVDATGNLFFTRKTMKFFGDTMENYGVRIASIEGEALYELYRKRPVKHNTQSSTYFDPITFKRRHLPN